jgi:hypothetical protein
VIRQVDEILQQSIIDAMKLLPEAGRCMNEKTA